MPNPWARERVENWVGDFCAGDGLRGFPSTVAEYAPSVLTELLLGACEAGETEPGDVGQEDLRRALLERVARLELPASVAAQVPDLCAGFLAQLEGEGRLADGRRLGLYLRALREPFADAAAGRQRPHVRPAARVGPNDPCPCGSGVKFKRCCKGTL